MVTAGTGMATEEVVAGVGIETTMDHNLGGTMVEIEVEVGAAPGGIRKKRSEGVKRSVGIRTVTTVVADTTGPRIRELKG